MKFKIVDDFEEEFTSKQNRQSRNSKHTEIVLTEEEKEQIAKELSDKKIDNKIIFGYVCIDDLGNMFYCKYNKETEDFVRYCYDRGFHYLLRKKSWREYTGDKAFDYVGEISE